MSRRRLGLPTAAIATLILAFAQPWSRPAQHLTHANSHASRDAGTDASPAAPDAGLAPVLPSASVSAAVEPPVQFARTVRVVYESDPRFYADIQVPVGWHHVPLVDAMNGRTFGSMVIAPDKSALVIVLTYSELWHEVAVNMTVDRWLGLSGGVSGIEPWGEPNPIEIGERRIPGTRVSGKGILGRDVADLWQIRRRFPSATTGKKALVAAGALQRSAPPERRRELFACAATFEPTPED